MRGRLGHIYTNRNPRWINPHGPRKKIEPATDWTIWIVTSLGEVEDAVKKNRVTIKNNS